MKAILAFAMMGILAGNAAGQTVYEPVRYQYGRSGGTFYGGVEPDMSYGGAVLNTPGVQALTEKFGYASPYRRPLRFDTRRVDYGRPLILSDIAPYVDAGKYGFTENDARNEAYANVLRIQTRETMSQLRIAGPSEVRVTVQGSPLLPTFFTRVYQLGQEQVRPVEGAVETRVMERVSGDEKAKAIPLLTWAKAERTKNPALFKALLQEAGKYDPEGAAKAAKE